MKHWCGHESNSPAPRPANANINLSIRFRGFRSYGHLALFLIITLRCFFLSYLLTVQCVPDFLYIQPGMANAILTDIHISLIPFFLFNAIELLTPHPFPFLSTPRKRTPFPHLKKKKIQRKRETRSYSPIKPLPPSLLKWKLRLPTRLLPARPLCDPGFVPGTLPAEAAIAILPLMLRAQRHVSRAERALCAVVARLQAAGLGLASLSAGRRGADVRDGLVFREVVPVGQAEGEARLD